MYFMWKVISDSHSARMYIMIIVAPLMRYIWNDMESYNLLLKLQVAMASPTHGCQAIDIHAFARFNFSIVPGLLAALAGCEIVVSY